MFWMFTASKCTLVLAQQRFSMPNTGLNFAFSRCFQGLVDRRGECSWPVFNASQAHVGFFFFFCSVTPIWKRRPGQCILVLLKKKIENWNQRGWIDFRLLMSRVLCRPNSGKRCQALQRESGGSGCVCCSVAATDRGGAERRLLWEGDCGGGRSGQERSVRSFEERLSFLKQALPIVCCSSWHQ